MSTDHKFYTLLDLTKYKETLEFLQSNQTQLTLKIKTKHYKSKILAKKNEKEFFLFKFNFDKLENEKIVCSFEIKAEQYFFTSAISTVQNDLIMSVPAEIFQLQRRNDFRVNIPIGSSFECVLRSVDGRLVKEKAEIRDLSLGGCQLIIDKSSFTLTKDSEIEFNFKMGNVDRDNIFCLVRHIVEIKNKKLSVGLEFKNTDADFLTDLQSLLVNLDRIHRGKTYE